jgi:hypothetical protein
MRVDLTTQVVVIRKVLIALKMYHNAYFVQTLSESVSNAPILTGGNSVEETAKSVKLMDKFFDCIYMHTISPTVFKPANLSKYHIRRSGKDMRFQVCGYRQLCRLITRTVQNRVEPA